MVSLFLDDERFPPEDGRNWHIVRSFAEATAWVEEHGCPALISFDHDLGEDGPGRELPTGMDFARWLSSRDLDSGCLPDDFEWRIHSANTAGRDNIAGLMKGHMAERERELAAGRPWPPMRSASPWAVD